MLSSLLRGPLELAVVGSGWHDLARVNWSAFRPHVALAGAESGTDIVPLLEGREGGADGPVAYVCRGFVCDLPTADPAELDRLLA